MEITKEIAQRLGAAARELTAEESAAMNSLSKGAWRDWDKAEELLREAKSSLQLADWDDVDEQGAAVELEEAELLLRRAEQRYLLLYPSRRRFSNFSTLRERRRALEDRWEALSGDQFDLASALRELAEES